jgi:hypothetical protein
MGAYIQRGVERESGFVSCGFFGHSKQDIAGLTGNISAATVAL